MIRTQIMDTVLATFGNFIIFHTIYRYLQPKKFAKYVQFIFPLIFSFYYYFISYSRLLNNLIPNPSIKQLLMPIAIFSCLAIYIAIYFNSDIKRKIIAFIASVVTMIVSESVIVALVMPFGLDANNAKSMQFEGRLLIDLTVLFLYTVNSLAIYFIFKNYKSRFPWSITLNVCSIILSCAILFLLIVNVTSTNYDYLKIAVSISLLCILLLIASLVSITKYINKQYIENEELYWKHQIHDLNIKYSQTINERSQEIRKIQHDFKDNLEILKLLLQKDSKESKEKANKLIEELNKNIDDSKIQYFTNNIVINALLTNKISEAKKLGIEIIPEISLTSDTILLSNIRDLDIDVLLINMLNNAIEACNSLKSNTAKIINIKIAVKGNFLFVKTINPYEKVKYNSKKELITTKQDKENHGLGMSIIESIVNTYNGSQTISCENNQFVHIVNLDLTTKINEY